MLRLPKFDYVAPPDLAGVLGVLSDRGEGARVIAGGTDLVPNLKRRQFEAAVLVSLHRVDSLRGVHGTHGSGLVIGALTPLDVIANHPHVQEHFRALSEAAGLVATPAIRTRATLAGNLLADTRCNYYDQTEPWRESLGWCMKAQGTICRVAPSSPRCLAVSSCDTAPALIALDARARLASPTGVREIALRELYRDDGIHYLDMARDEVLTEIALPPLGPTRSTYLKLRRRGSFDFPVLGVAARVSRAADGAVADARVVLTGIASRPVEIPEAAKLVGALPSDDAIAEVARAAEQRAKPLDNTDLTIVYRKRMARVYVARALRRCL